MRAITYVRVSTEDQAKHGYSIEAQREACRKKAEDLGAIIVEDFGDEGVSGSILNRPGLDDALARLKETRASFFICMDPDRLARNLAHQLIITDDIEKTGAKLIFVNMDFQNTPEGRLFYAMRGAISEYEKEKIKERSRRGKIQKAKQGKLTHNPRIYGYDYDKESSTLSVNQEAARVITMMYRWMAEERISYYEVTRRLNSMGIPSPRNSVWQKATVKRILQNPAYTGTIYFNRYNTEGRKYNRYRSEKEKVSTTIRPEEEWIPIHIPQIIPDKLWLEVQARLSNARRLRPGNTLGEYLLSGLVVCGLCGSPCSGVQAKSKTGDKHLYYYRCAGRTRHKNGCTLPYIPTKEIEEQVWAKICEWVLTPALFLEEANNSNQKTELTKELHQVEKAIRAAQQEKQRLTYLFQKGLIGIDDVERNLSDIQERIGILKSRGQEIERELARGDITLEQLSYLEDMGTYLGNKLNGLTFAERQRIVRMVVSQVVATPDIIEVFARLSQTIDTSYNPSCGRPALPGGGGRDYKSGRILG